MGRKNKYYSVELKQKVVREYLEGNLSVKKLCYKYDIADRNRIYRWTEMYESGNKNFVDMRGKKSKGRPKKIKDIKDMTKDEYIAHLELENKILKSFAEMLDDNKS